MKRIAVVPGSYDPVTLGHLDLIARACALFDEVHAVVMVNAGKSARYSMEARAEMLAEAVRPLPRVQVGRWDGMLWAYVRQAGACAIVKGVRSPGDFAYEIEMERFNSRHIPAETVLLVARAEYMDLSSTLVRRKWDEGGDLSALVPPGVPALMEKHAPGR